MGARRGGGERGRAAEPNPRYLFDALDVVYLRLVPSRDRFNLNVSWRAPCREAPPGPAWPHPLHLVTPSRQLALSPAYYYTLCAFARRATPRALEGRSGLDTGRGRARQRG